jgi:hypothetical protein
VTALVTDDYGILIGGVRYESPDLAAQAVSEGLESDGWNYWTLRSDDESPITLRELLRT